MGVRQSICCTHSKFASGFYCAKSVYLQRGKAPESTVLDFDIALGKMGLFVFVFLGPFSGVRVDAQGFT